MNDRIGILIIVSFLGIPSGLATSVPVKTHTIFNIDHVAKATYSNDSFATPLLSSASFPVSYKTYFENLKNNFGYNQVGSCSYVALSSLLTYYDTFLSDSIVPEAYDIVSSADTASDAISNSPGSKHYFIDEDYTLGVESTKGTVLQSRLMYEYKKFYGKYNFGINLDEYKGILSNFMENSIDYQLTYFQRESNESIDEVDARLRSMAISKIQSGVPVILSISGYNSPGDDEYAGYHTVVGYDYTDQDDIYAHFGWNASTAHSTLKSQGYGRILQLAYLDFSIEHMHSNNYKIIDNYRCFDGVDPYQHVHSFTYRVKNSNQHYAICDCGFSMAQLHSFRQLGATESYCVFCGFSKQNIYNAILFEQTKVGKEY